MFLGAVFVPLNINLRCDLASLSSEGAQLSSLCQGIAWKRVKGVGQEREVGYILFALGGWGGPCSRAMQAAEKGMLFCLLSTAEAPYAVEGLLPYVILQLRNLRAQQVR